MNENNKTICFVGAAVLVLVAAFATRAKTPVVNVSDRVGKTLFDKLDDPLKAKRLEIDTVDEATSQTRKLEVAQVNGAWCLPSHQNYLADAKDQVASAVTALMEMKVLEPVQAKDTKGVPEHELYGVVEPKPAEDQVGQRGIGKLVVVSDAAGKSLARVIIGKEDKPLKKDEFGGAVPSQLRFVRIPGQDQVYRVELKADKFSPKFEDWIETDLLKLQPWDVTEIKLRDYSLLDAISSSGAYGKKLDPRADIDLVFDDKTSKWELKQMVEYKGRSKEETKLGEDEELNTTKLNDMKNALGTLKIIDVARKPAQLGANLRAGKEAFNDEALDSLQSRGFYPQPVGEDQFEIFSNEGQAVVQMKDGIEYVLRFGKVAGIDTGGDEKKTDAEPKAGTDKNSDASDEKSEKKDKAGLSRYIMVMARFNQDLLTKPELEPLPDAKKSTDKAADAKKTDAKSADAKGKDAKAAAPKADAKADAKDAKKSADAKKDESKKDTSKSADTKSGDAKSAAGGESNKDAGDDQEALDAERDRVEAANKRKQDTFDQKVKDGEQKAKELNARFADWYYVVGEDTYRKIHVGKSDIVKKKPKDTKDNKDSAATTTPGNPFNLNALPAGKK
jgi:hypothetical protein